MRELQKKIQNGRMALKEDDPFETFIAATDIRYCYYSETHKILGQTFGMLVLQVRPREMFFLTYKNYVNVMAWISFRTLKLSLLTFSRELSKQ